MENKKEAMPNDEGKKAEMPKSNNAKSNSNSKMLIIAGIAVGIIVLCCICSIVSFAISNSGKDSDNNRSDSDNSSDSNKDKDDSDEDEIQTMTIDELSACSTEANDKRFKVEGYLQAPTAYLFCYGTCTIKLANVPDATETSKTIDTWITLTETDGKNTIALPEVNTGIDSFTFRDNDNSVIDPLNKVTLTGTWSAYQTDDGENSCYLKVSTLEQ